MAEPTTIVGFIAGVVTTTANLPQVWRTYRKKSGEGLSFRMLLMLGIGVALWLVYGIMSKSLPLIGTNDCASADIVVDWDEVEIRSFARKGLNILEKQTSPNN